MIYEDESIGGAIKAEHADRTIFTKQTFTQSPDYWTSNASFASPTKVTDANPFIKEYRWGSKVLVDFKNSKGQRLQGTLTLPAGYRPPFDVLVPLANGAAPTANTLCLIDTAGLVRLFGPVDNVDVPIDGISFLID